MYSKLFILLLCFPVLYSEYCAYLFYGLCEPFRSSWWNGREYCMHCLDGKKYHCTKNYDTLKYVEGCAYEKFCLKGEEPLLSFVKDGNRQTEPVVYCKTCSDQNRFNDHKNTSSTHFSECPSSKQNICNSAEHKILCKPDDSTSERLCRCDARSGHRPYNFKDGPMCSTNNYECINTKCNALPDGSPQQLLLDYTCAPFCKKGFNRSSENNDSCLPIPTVYSPEPPTVPSPAHSVTTAGSIPNYTETPKAANRTVELVCVPECDTYRVCDGGSCVCPNVCPDVEDPVCGYHGDSGQIRTFTSTCHLKREYCTDKKFLFKYQGECKTDSNTLIIVGCVVLVPVAMLAIGCLIYRCRAKGPEFAPCCSRYACADSPVSGAKGPNGISQRRGSSEPTVTVMQITKNYISGDYNKIRGKHIQLAAGDGSSITTVDRKGNPIAEETCLLLEDSGEDSSSIDGIDVQPGGKERVQTAKPNNDNKADVHDGVSSSECIGLVKDVEADTDGAETITQHFNDAVQETGQNVSVKETVHRIRRYSVSLDSVFHKPDINNVKDLKDVDSKALIKKVMDICLCYLLDNLNPSEMLDMFTKREMLTNVKRRDIRDEKTQSEQIRMIVKEVRAGSIELYHNFKLCMLDSKHEDCLMEVETKQKEAYNKLTNREGIIVPQGCGSLKTGKVHKLEKAESEKLIPENIPENNEQVPCQTINTETVGQTEKAAIKTVETNNDIQKPDSPQADEVQNSTKQYANQQLPIKRTLSCVPPKEIIDPEEQACSYLRVLTKASSFDLFTASANSLQWEIKEKYPGLLRIPSCLTQQPLVLKEYSDCPDGFQSCYSSGLDNCCLYQSVSLLLFGTEQWQHRLRLKATLYCCEQLKTYKKQSYFQHENIDTVKQYFYGHSNEATWKCIKNMTKLEEILEECLPALIRETACIGCDSSRLHVNFLTQALEMHIKQFFQIRNHYGASLDEIPFNPLPESGPVLHIFWVDVNGKKERMNHIVPLLKKD